MFLIFRILILALLFWFLQPSYESIYYYHFGSVTNSDALYPYLFIKDFNLSLTWVSGWVTPPSHCLFPDLIIIYILQKFTTDIYLIHFWFAFFCFLSVLYLIRALGFSRSVGVVAALCFLRLGEFYPQSWGQFFLPSFHGTEFFLLGLCIRIIRYKEKISYLRSILLGLVIGFSIYSELWFLVHSLGPILLFVLMSDYVNSKKLAITIGFGILSYLLLFQVQKKIGIGSFHPKQFPLSESLKSAAESFIQNPLDYTGSILSLTQNLPLAESLVPIFYALVFITLFQFLKRPNLIKHMILPLGFILALLFVRTSNIEANTRYFYLLPLSCISLGFFQIQSYPKFSKLISYLALIGLIFVSHRYWIYESTRTNIESGKTKHTERLRCVNETIALWGNTPGSSTYWPVKYLRSFSEGKIQVVPFTPEGIYYPWVHNLNWDKQLLKIETNAFLWGILPSDQEIIFGKKGIETILCQDWRLIRISKSH